MRFKFIFVLVLLFFLASALFVSSRTVLSEPSMCCEKTKSGFWCVNDLEENCDSNYRSAPASCDATSYCRLGTCYDSSEGICYENTPQRVCEDNGGTWDFRRLQEVPQCQLGCCLISDQAAFVPLVRCKRLSTYFGVEMNYRTDIQTEVECIVLANSQDMGACVYERDYERFCEFTTRHDCGAQETVDSIHDPVEFDGSRRFFKDYLCSAEELGTICARQTTTGCYQGKVYWFDSCGNRENVYSANRDLSWNKGRVLDPDLICPPNDGSDPGCGNCDYMLGSRCEAKHGLLAGQTAVCMRTDCIDRWGNTRLNGESWCVNDGMSGGGLDKVGSRYYREICVDGKVRVEPCADFRNEVCYESSVPTSKGNYAVAACRVNRWQACIGITDEGACLNRDKRDCIWLESPIGLLIGGNPGDSEGSGISHYSQPGQEEAFGSPTTAPITGAFLFSKPERTEDEITTTNRPYGVCVPRFPPGLQFWDEGSQGVCGLVSGRCVVEFSKGAFGDWECVDNCECLTSDWAIDMNRICTAMGDCGAYINYIGRFTDSGYEWLSPDGRRAFRESDERVIMAGFTGRVVSDVSQELEDGINDEIIRKMMEEKND